MAKQERDPQQTKKKILEAALVEFTHHGLDGARVDNIVKNAGVNKRMVYHYFGNKLGLFNAVFKDQVITINQVLKESPTDSAVSIVKHWLDNTERGEGFLKLQHWIESADQSDFELDAFDEMSSHFKEAIDLYQGMQKEGKISKDISPEMLLIVTMAMVSFPMMFPRFVGFASSMDPKSEDFRKQYFEVILNLFTQK